MDRNRRDFMKTASAATATLAVAGCLGGPGEGTDPEPDASGNQTNTTGNQTNATDSDFYDIEGDIQTPDNLEVTQQRLFQTAGGVGVFGSVENVGDQAYEYVEATVTLEDDAGDVLFDVVDQTEEDAIDLLAPGATWDFRVYFQEVEQPPQRIASYSITVSGDLADQAGLNGNNTTMGGNNTTMDGNTIIGGGS